MSTEQEILKVIRKTIPRSKKYLFDDAAIIEKNLILTTDTLVENTHFTLKTYTPEEVGWKAIAVNLSDIAAMGGKPLYALVSLSLPTNIKLPWINSFYKGLTNCANKYKAQIIGGNLARAKEINITITLIGKVNDKNIGKRSNAKEGDLVFTTGTFGDSACGFLLLKNKKKLLNNLVNIHKKPIPRIELGQKIIKLTKRVSLMDASDGLADCLIQISNQSKVRIIIDKDKIPVSQNTKSAANILNRDFVDLSLYGGEDYQLVGTASKTDCTKLAKIKEIKIIGRVINGKGSFLKQNNNRLVRLNLRKTYEHFS